MRRLVLMVTLCTGVIPNPLQAQCGGTERWAVKLGADPGATLIDLQNPIPTSLHDLVTLPRPTLPPKKDDSTRTAAEQSVRIVEGRLVKFKQELAKDGGDSDFHLVISDATLLFSPPGANTQPSPHSVIAEIPDPACVGGAHGTVVTPSRFQTQLDAVRAKFLQQFPNVSPGWNDADGIPVRLTGVGFFDRPHGQVGRALNGLELHPLLDIEFNPGSPDSVIPAVLLVNPGFEQGAQGWTASAGVITAKPDEHAHTGQGKAWLGGYGTTHTDRLWQQVALPAAAHGISLTFYLHIDSEEEGEQAFDRLRVQVRDAGGHLLQTLKTFSNLQTAPGFTLRSIDLTGFKGRTVRIELEAQEDNGSLTSFVVDDFALVIEP